jgi:tetratricopeptide (TPR) repeat protein
MYDFEYHNIIDFWTGEFNLYMSMKERKEVIELYEQALIRYNPDIDFNKLCQNLCLKKYLDKKYGSLRVFERVFTYAGMN